MTLYMDGSSFLQEGVRNTGDAVETDRVMLWRRGLSPGISAQTTELISLTQVLLLSQGKTANIYTDIRYAFATAHDHGALYWEPGLLTLAGKDIKN